MALNRQAYFAKQAVAFIMASDCDEKDPSDEVLVEPVWTLT